MDRKAVAVGIDANVFIRHFVQGDSKASSVLKAAAAGEICGVTTREVLLETAHRLMVFEAIGKGLVKGNNPARRLRGKPKGVAGLNDYYQDLQTIKALGIQCLPALPDPIGAGHVFRQKYGLLVNDSVLLATLVAHGVKYLATEDRDFAGLDEVAVWVVEEAEG